MSHNSLDNLPTDFLNIVTRSTHASKYIHRGSLGRTSDRTATCNSIAIDDNS
ncbi:MAG: hypothetical protein V7L01_12535 [Nostoc sp.]